MNLSTKIIIITVLTAVVAFVLPLTYVNILEFTNDNPMVVVAITDLISCLVGFFFLFIFKVHNNVWVDQPSNKSVKAKMDPNDLDYIIRSDKKWTK